MKNNKLSLEPLILRITVILMITALLYYVISNKKSNQQYYTVNDINIDTMIEKHYRYDINIQSIHSIDSYLDSTYYIITRIWIKDLNTGKLSLEYNEMSICKKDKINTIKKVEYNKAFPIYKKSQKQLNNRDVINKYDKL